MKLSTMLLGALLALAVASCGAARPVEFRGLSLGMTPAAAGTALRERQMMAFDDEREPTIGALISPLPPVARTQSIFADRPECLAERNQKIPEGEVFRIRKCPVLGRLYFGKTGRLVAAQLSLGAFDIDSISVGEFAQDIVNEYRLGELRPEPFRSVIGGRCTVYRGAAGSGELVTVHDCSGVQFQIQLKSETGAAYR